MLQLSILVDHGNEVVACLCFGQTLLSFSANSAPSLLARALNSSFCVALGLQCTVCLQVCRFVLNSQAEEAIPPARLFLSPSPSVAVFRVGS
jgi:hypothetical protein